MRINPCVFRALPQSNSADGEVGFSHASKLSCQTALVSVPGDDQILQSIGVDHGATRSEKNFENIMNDMPPNMPRSVAHLGMVCIH